MVVKSGSIFARVALLMPAWIPVAVFAVRVGSCVTSHVELRLCRVFTF